MIQQNSMLGKRNEKVPYFWWILRKQSIFLQLSSIRRFFKFLEQIELQLNPLVQNFFQLVAVVSISESRVLIGLEENQSNRRI